MIASIYHRSQKPWVFQAENGKIGITIRVKKNAAKKIELYFKDSMGDFDQARGKPIFKKIIMTYQASDQYFDYYESIIFCLTKRYRYGFKITNNLNEEIIWGESGKLKDLNHISEQGHGFTYAYWNEANFLNVPQSFRQTNWYQIFPDRFAKNANENTKFVAWNSLPQSHEFFGGNLLGIIDKLDYLKSLGFNGIYLTPIFEAKTAHRYETNNYLKIDPLLGDEEDFKLLIKSAHAKGIKVMLDAVFNHIGYHAKQFQDVLKHRENSKYKNWFWINDYQELKQSHHYQKGEFVEKYPYETFGFASEMPRLNWNNQAVTNFLLAASEKWTKMGIDGWRLDVSFEVPISFWQKFNQLVRKLNPNIAIIGEVWWDAIEFLEKGIWDGVMNYPLREIIIDYVSSEQDQEAKKVFVEKFNHLAFKYTPEQQWGMFNLLSSHDTPRLITLLNNHQLKYEQALKMMAFQPGSLSIYYGEEIALPGKQDPDNRRSFPRDEVNHNLQMVIKKVNQERLAFVNASDIYQRYVARLEEGNIVFTNQTNKVVIDDMAVIRMELKDEKNY